MTARWRRFRSAMRNCVGLNSRNLELLETLNPPALRRLADDKLVAKQRLAAAGVPIARTLEVIERLADLPRLARLVERTTEGFALKPACSSGGQGIVIVRRTAEGEITASGLDGARAGVAAALGEHTARILGGEYSPQRLSDRAFAEALVIPDEALARLSTGGVPDIRVITLEGRPVMAMLRLATRRSGGRANLHQGAIGVGIDLESGRTTSAVDGRRTIDRHPDSGRPLWGVTLPAWKETLEVAVNAAAAFPLGYLGVDIVVDRVLGPVVFEVNARPGLAIQLANRQGLRELLAEAGFRKVGS